jgi:hypothetical protein
MGLRSERGDKKKKEKEAEKMVYGIAKKVGLRKQDGRGNDQAR